MLEIELTHFKIQNKPNIIALPRKNSDWIEIKKQLQIKQLWTLQKNGQTSEKKLLHIKNTNVHKLSWR